MKNRGIAFKLTVLMMSSITLILASVWLYNYSLSRSETIAEIETFMNDVSTTRTNMAIASSRERISVRSVLLEPGAEDAVDMKAFSRFKE